MIRGKHFRTIRYACVLICIVSAIAFGHYITTRTDGVYKYTPVRDRQFILDQFKQDMYWLVSERSTQFSAECMLDHKSLSKNFDDIKDLSIYVYQHKQKPVGFTVFYKESFYKGKLLFLHVNAGYRRMGVAQKLMEFALAEFKKQGITVVKLVTRTNNDRAQALYKKLGFVPRGDRDDGFVDFEKVL